MKRYGCRYGQPHDLVPTAESPTVKWEVCRICNKKFRWNKGAKTRIDNVRYLEAHARNYAQQGGATKRLFMKLYEPERCIIKL